MQFLSGVSRFLPSRRISALVVVVAALVVATVIFRSDASGIAEKPVARLTSEPEQMDETDTDGDGVRDWEEDLWGLSHVSPDTDGDGVGDADEIKEEQARTEEQKNSLLFGASVSGDTSYEGLSETERLSRGILEQVVAFQDAGIGFDQEVTGDIASILGSSLHIEPPTRKTIDPSLIKSVPETSESLVAYTNALGIILGGTATEETNELLALAKFGETGDASTLGSLSAVVATYDTIVTELTRTSVPATLVNEHIVLVNAFMNTREAIALFSYIATDPVRALAGIQAYQGNAAALAEAFATVREYLQVRVVLSSNAPGYVIIQEVPAM